MTWEKSPFFLLVLETPSNKPQNLNTPQKAITVQNVEWRNIAQWHSPTRVCRSDGDQWQDLQREAGWSLDVLWFTFQVSLFQLSKGQRGELNIAAWKSPYKIGFHASKRVFLFITGVQCFLRGLKQTFKKVNVINVSLAIRHYVMALQFWREWNYGKLEYEKCYQESDDINRIFGEKLELITEI